MSRRGEQLPNFPADLAALGWRLTKAPGINAVQATNDRLHCASPNFASDGRDWARKKAEQAAARGVAPEAPRVRDEIVAWARRMTALATPLVEALDRALPSGDGALRPFLAWSLSASGPRPGLAIAVSAGYATWWLQPRDAGWLLFPPPPPRDPPPLWLPEALLDTVWHLLAAHDAGPTARQRRRVMTETANRIRAWALARDIELAGDLPTPSTETMMSYTRPSRIAREGLRALLALPPGQVDGPLLRSLLEACGCEGEIAVLEHARGAGAGAALMVQRAAAALTADGLLDAAAWAETLPPPEQRLLQSTIAPHLMRHDRHVETAQRLLVQIEDEAETADALNHAADLMPLPLLRSWIDVARTWGEEARSRALVALLRSLSARGPDAASEALGEVDSIDVPFARALARALILTHLTEIGSISATAHDLRRDVAALAGDERDELAALIVEPLAQSGLGASAIDLAARCGAATRDELLLRIVETLLEREAPQALVAARQVADPERRAEAALRVGERLAPSERPAALDIAYSAAQDAANPARARLLLAVAKQLADSGGVLV